MLNLNKASILTRYQVMTCVDPDGKTITYKSHEQWPYTILIRHNRGHWVVFKVGSADFITPIWNTKLAGSQSSRYALRSFTKVGA
jgi:hypothetical protein